MDLLSSLPSPKSPRPRPNLSLTNEQVKRAVKFMLDHPDLNFQTSEAWKALARDISCLKKLSWGDVKDYFKLKPHTLVTNLKQFGRMPHGMDACPDLSKRLSWIEQCVSAARNIDDGNKENCTIDPSLQTASAGDVCLIGKSPISSSTGIEDQTAKRDKCRRPLRSMVEDFENDEIVAVKRIKVSFDLPMEYHLTRKTYLWKPTTETISGFEELPDQIFFGECFYVVPYKNIILSWVKQYYFQYLIKLHGGKIIPKPVKTIDANTFILGSDDTQLNVELMPFGTVYSTDIIDYAVNLNSPVKTIASSSTRFVLSALLQQTSPCRSEVTSVAVNCEVTSKNMMSTSPPDSDMDREAKNTSLGPPRLRNCGNIITIEPGSVDGNCTSCLGLDGQKTPASAWQPIVTQSHCSNSATEQPTHGNVTNRSQQAEPHKTPFQTHFPAVNGDNECLILFEKIVSPATQPSATAAPMYLKNDSDETATTTTKKMSCVIGADFENDDVIIDETNVNGVADIKQEKEGEAVIIDAPGPCIEMSNVKHQVCGVDECSDNKKCDDFKKENNVKEDSESEAERDDLKDDKSCDNHEDYGLKEVEMRQKSSNDTSWTSNALRITNECAMTSTKVINNLVCLDNNEPTEDSSNHSYQVDLFESASKGDTSATQAVNNPLLLDITTNNTSARNDDVLEQTKDFHNEIHTDETTQKVDIESIDIDVLPSRKPNGNKTSAAIQKSSEEDIIQAVFNAYSEQTKDVSSLAKAASNILKMDPAKEKVRNFLRKYQKKEEKGWQMFKELCNTFIPGGSSNDSFAGVCELVFNLKKVDNLQTVLAYM